MSDSKERTPETSDTSSALGFGPGAFGVRVSDATTRGVRVQVESLYVPERSSPRDQQYFFAYHVRISNVGTDTVKLISREWTITDADGEVERVSGPGVVGEQPELIPGRSFEYTSFCPLKTSVGAMFGVYHMVTSDGDKFEATIAPFTLAIPNAVN